MKNSCGVETGNEATLDRVSMNGHPSCPSNSYVIAQKIYELKVVLMPCTDKLIYCSNESCQ